MKSFFQCLTVAVLILIGCGKQTQQSNSVAQNELSRGALLLDSNSIDYVQVAHEPNIEHPVRVTVSGLIKGSSYMLKLSGPGLSPHSKALATALRESDASPSQWSGEVYWAVALYDRNGKETLAIGLDDSGRNGYIGTQAAHFQNDRMLKWMKSVLPN